MRPLLFVFLLVFSACTNTAVQRELQTVQQELEIAKEKINHLETQIEPEGTLVHLVFFKLKSDINSTAFVQEAKKLASIKGVMDFEIGPYEDLDDQRALSDYSMLMQMSFEDKIAYKNYQKHPTHLALIETTKPFMAGPPATYDFIKK